MTYIPFLGGLSFSTRVVLIGPPLIFFENFLKKWWKDTVFPKEIHGIANFGSGAYYKQLIGTPCILFLVRLKTWLIFQSTKNRMRGLCVRVILFFGRKVSLSKGSQEFFFQLFLQSQPDFEHYACAAPPAVRDVTFRKQSP